MGKLPDHFYFRVRAGLTKVELEDASDADVVEVIRCAECTFSRPEESFDGTLLCGRLKGKGGEPVGISVWPDDFCSRAERRTDGSNL